MRNAFADEIMKIAIVDERLVLLSGDIGNKLFDRYKAQFPNRFYNCGVAEANMASVAAGMAMCGLRPITYTITPFNTTRCLEQIRVDICYHNLPVIIIGLGAGLSYASLGCTHHSCEDISFLRSLPNMTVVCPADSFELVPILRQAMQAEGPTYIRIGKKGEPAVYTSYPDVTIGKAHIVRPGTDVCLLATGNVLPLGMEIAKTLEKEISVQLVSMHTVKPLDKAFLRSAFEEFPLVVSLEEHSLIGGLGSAIAECVVDEDIRSSRLLRFGTADRFPHSLGEQQFIRDSFGLNSENLAQIIKSHCITV